MSKVALAYIVRYIVTMENTEHTAEKGAGFPPIRLCCGERHWGPVCPDSKVMCCLCFERFAQDDLAYDPESVGRVDVCKPCMEREQARATPPGAGE